MAAQSGVGRLSSGAEVVPVEGAEAGAFRRLFQGYTGGLVRVGRGGYLYPASYTRWAEDYLNFEFRPSDVLVATYPKCGTTWTQEIVWTMLHNPDLRHPSAPLHTDKRSPHIEFDCLTSDVGEPIDVFPDMATFIMKETPESDPKKGLFIELARHIKGRRVLKTHLPFSLLPKNLLDVCKVVYVTRNPKDVVCSFLHHHRILKGYGYVGSDDQFVEYFCSGDVQNGCYSQHLAELQQRRQHPNLIHLTYEELQRDKHTQISRLDAFLGTGLTEEQRANVAAQSTFRGMKERMDKQMTESEEPSQGPKPSFYRKGKSGSWKTDLSPELITRMDRYTEEKITKPLGLKFD